MTTVKNGRDPKLREEPMGDLDDGLLGSVHSRDHQWHVNDLAGEVVARIGSFSVSTPMTKSRSPWSPSIERMP